MKLNDIVPIFSKGKPKNDKRMLDKSVDGRDQKKTIKGSFLVRK